MMKLLAATPGPLLVALLRDRLRFALPFAIVIVGGLLAALFIGVYHLTTMHLPAARDTDRLPFGKQKSKSR